MFIYVARWAKWMFRNQSSCFFILQTSLQLISVYHRSQGNCMLVLALALVLSSKTWHYSHLFSLCTGIIVFSPNFLIYVYTWADTNTLLRTYLTWNMCVCYIGPLYRQRHSSTGISTKVCLYRLFKMMGYGLWKYVATVGTHFFIKFLKLTTTHNITTLYIFSPVTLYKLFPLFL